MTEAVSVLDCNHVLSEDECFCRLCDKRFVYDNGLAFSDKLAENLGDLVLRIKRKKASLLIIDGGVGEGKTTLAIHVAEYIQGRKLDFKRQYAFGGVEFQERLQMCVDSDLLVIVYDEAGDFNSRGALTRFNQMLNRVFETYRTFKILVILVLPNFGVLDQSLFDKQIPRILLHCEDRTELYGGFSLYSLYRMYHIRAKMKKIIVTPDAYNNTFPNCRGHFLDLKPKESIELDSLSTERKRGILSVNVIRNRGHLSVKDLCNKLQRSDRWVLSKIKSNKVECATMFKKTKYYPQDALQILENEKKGALK